MEDRYGQKRVRFKDKSVKAGLLDIFCVVVGLFLMSTQSVLADRVDSSAESIKSTQRSADTADSDKSEFIRQRVIQPQRELMREPEVQRVQERVPAEAQSSEVEEAKKFSVPKRIELNRQEALRNELKNLQIEKDRVRKNSRQLEQRIIEKQESLRSIRQPSVRQRLQREIGDMQQTLERYQEQLQDLENQQQILRQTTTASQGFADDAEHMSDSQYGQDGWGSGGRRKDHCFIATAAYGSPLSKEVQILRHFRDDYLIKTELGRHFIKIYYEYSPPVADFVAQYAFARFLTQAVLWPVVAAIQYPVVSIIIFNLAFFGVVLVLFRYKKALHTQ